MRFILRPFFSLHPYTINTHSMKRKGERRKKWDREMKCWGKQQLNNYTHCNLLTNRIHITSVFLLLIHRAGPYFFAQFTLISFAMRLNFSFADTTTKDYKHKSSELPGILLFFFRSSVFVCRWLMMPLWAFGTLTSDDCIHAIFFTNTDHLI